MFPRWRTDHGNAPVDFQPVCIFARKAFIADVLASVIPCHLCQPICSSTISRPVYSVTQSALNLYWLDQALPDHGSIRHDSMLGDL